MLLYQVIEIFLGSTRHSSIKSMYEQSKKYSYQELIDYFKYEYLSQDIINKKINEFVDLSKGNLIIDEIILLKSKSNGHKFVKKRYKSSGGHVVPGVSIVLLVWTNGEVRIPLRFRLQMNGEKHTESALNLMSWFRNKISKRINYITFDAGFSSEKILKRIEDYGWCFVTRIPKTRKFNNKQAKKAHRGGYYTKVGYVSGIKVKVVRRESKFYISNRLGLLAKKIESIYSDRSIIEEVFRILKQECHWSRCQLREYRDYENYYTVGIMSFICLEYMRIKDYGRTIYKIRKDILLGQLNIPIFDLEYLSA